MSPITSHVLDTARGTPAAGITVVIEFDQDTDKWIELARAITDANGRIAQFAPDLKTLDVGRYRLRFFTAAYFEALGARAFYPLIDVTVQIDGPTEHYHIPLLLSPFGYTTYRGRPSIGTARTSRPVTIIRSIVFELGEKMARIHRE
jgi:5-hydroxyisourate hydrolase